jgi:hypothetical protein
MTRAPRCASGEKQREMQQGTIHGKHQVRGQPSICITNCAERDGALTAQKDGVALGFGRQVAGSNRRPSSGLGRDGVHAYPGMLPGKKEKGGRSHPSQTTIAEGHQGYRSLLPVCRSSPGAGSTARAPKALMPMKSFSLPLVLGSSLVGTARGVAWIRTRGENRMTGMNHRPRTDLVAV